ncbi:hypothetical protein DL98DRAFT_524857 [Cadophora sp. DSE1049]|nr:hypothetical protein DL98DRAFT_524857 [Cadophora sp. DSE1049]
MEPLSALGFAVNILTLVELSAKLLSKGNAIFKSANGTLEENDRLDVIATRLRDLTTELERSIGTTEDQNELALIAISRSCTEISHQILQKLARLAICGSITRFKSYRQALKSKVMDSTPDLYMDCFPKYANRQKVDANASEQALLFGNLISSHKDGLDSQLKAHGTTQGMLAYENEKTRQVITAAIFQMAQWGLAARYPKGISISYHEAKKQASRLSPTSIIESLAFPMQQDRFEGIPEAYSRTFEWVWQDKGPFTPVSHDLARWLQQGDGLFWISGKPGSGKSTFMKYISQDCRTMQHLYSWVQGGQFVFSKFFFWKGGSVLQRSQNGLLRSLLYSALRQYPSLVVAILPEKLEKVEQVLADHLYESQLDAGSLTTFSLPPKLRYELEAWPLSELSEAFYKLLHQTTVNVKSFFLVDGLDEYDGDHSEIVRLFQKASSSSTVKICMSSRPLNVYERAFDTLPGFRIQDLTEKDIRLYVSEKIQQSSEILQLSGRQRHHSEQLIQNIVSKASGVFLWVALVVKSLLEGFTNNDTMSDLQKRLDLLPPDLEDLYRHMINKIDPIYRPRASRFFQIVSHTDHALLTLLLSLADEEDVNRPLTAKIELMPETEQFQRVREIDARTRSVCAGLLEVHHKDPSYSTVHFMHRTVFDFFARTDIRDMLREFTAGTPFQADVAILGSCILELKWLIKQPSSATECSRFWDTVQQGLLVASNADTEGSNLTVDLMDEFDRVATYHWSSCIKDNPKLNHETGHWTNWMPKEYDPSNVFLKNTFISHTVRYQLTSYLRNKGQADPLILHQAPNGRPLLSVAIPPLQFTGFQVPPAPQTPSLTVVEILLESGADPNEPYLGQSPWQNALQQVCGFQPSPLHSLPSTTLHFGQTWTRIFDIMLYYGASIDAEISTGNGGGGGGSGVRSVLSVVSDVLLVLDPVGARELQRKLVAQGAMYRCQAGTGETEIRVGTPGVGARRDGLQARLRVPYRLRSIVPEDGARLNLYLAARSSGR